MQKISVENVMRYDNVKIEQLLKNRKTYPKMSLKMSQNGSQQ